jgi:hypothetical protein
MADQEVPRTLDELRGVRGDEAIVRAADAYIANGKQKLHVALVLRDAAIQRLAEKHGPAATARKVGKSLSTIKQIRGRS